MQKSSLILFETIKWSHFTQPINHENVQIFLVKIIQILTKEKYFPQCVPCYVCVHVEREIRTKPNLSNKASSPSP